MESLLTLVFGDFSQNFETGVDDAALFIWSDIEKEVRVAGVCRFDFADDLFSRDRGFESLFPKPFVFQFPARLAGMRVVFRKMARFRYGDVGKWHPLFSPIPPIPTGDDVRAEASNPSVRLLRSHDGVVQAIVPNIKRFGIFLHQLGNLLFLKFDLLGKPVFRRITLRRQNLVSLGESRTTPTVINPHFQTPAGE